MVPCSDGHFRAHKTGIRINRKHKYLLSFYSFFTTHVLHTSPRLDCLEKPSHLLFNGFWLDEPLSARETVQCISELGSSFLRKQNSATYVKCKQWQVHTVRILWINFHQGCGNVTHQALPANAQFVLGLKKWWWHILRRAKITRVC